MSEKETIPYWLDREFMGHKIDYIFVKWFTRNVKPKLVKHRWDFLALATAWVLYKLTMLQWFILFSHGPKTVALTLVVTWLVGYNMGRTLRADSKVID